MVLFMIVLKWPITNYSLEVLSSVRTNAFSKAGYVFLLSSKTHRSICVHTAVLMHFRESKLKHSKMIRIARCDVS